MKLEYLSHKRDKVYNKLDVSRTSPLVLKLIDDMKYAYFNLIVH